MILSGLSEAYSIDVSLTVRQEGLVGGTIVAKLAFVDEIVGEMRCTAKGIEVEGAGVCELVSERRFQRLAGHNTRGRDVHHLLRVPEYAGCESKAQIV